MIYLTPYRVDALNATKLRIKKSSLHRELHKRLPGPYVKDKENLPINFTECKIIP
jgi:hypothetical protein